MAQLTFLYDKEAQNLEPSQIIQRNVLCSFAAPVCTCLTDITADELADKAKSLGGLKCCLWPEDPLFAYSAAHTLVCRTLSAAQPCFTALMVGPTCGPSSLHLWDSANRGRGSSRGRNRARATLAGPRPSKVPPAKLDSYRPSEQSPLVAAIVMSEQSHAVAARLCFGMTTVATNVLLCFWGPVAVTFDWAKDPKALAQKLGIALQKLPAQTNPEAVLTEGPDSPDLSQVVRAGADRPEEDPPPLKAEVSPTAKQVQAYCLLFFVPSSAHLYSGVPWQ